MAEYHEDYYGNLLDKNQSGFLNMLNRSIIKGDNAKEETLKMLEVVSSHPLRQQMLIGFRDSYGDCLIHNVAKFHQSTNVLKRLLATCPKSLLTKRLDRFSGQTALHIVVTKGNLKATRAMLRHVTINNENDLPTLLHVKATGSLFANTVMMGELALSVAALTLNTNIVNLLLKHGARVAEKNSKGDTVFHSLIRFAVIHPEKLESIIKMIEHINSQLSASMVSVVWYNAENSENLTALKLAAALGQVEIFSGILKLEDVYCKLNHHDGLFDIYLFDITEIDTITQAEWERNKIREKKLTEKSDNSSKMGDNNMSFQKQAKKQKPAAQSHRPALIHLCPAVLDIICHLPTATAFRLMNVDVVNDVIKTKWSHYRKFYYLWFLIHFIMMSLITVYAVYKTEVINERIYSTPTTNNTSSSSSSSNFETSSLTEGFVFITSLLSVIYAAPYLIYEVFRSLYFKQDWHLDVIHHNGLYRLMLTAMSLALVADAVWFWIEPDNNYCLVMALLIGWTFMNFFLRALKIFSFFTVMLQKVLLGDMTRFSVIIIFQLIAFSVAMYITFLNTNPVPSGFETLGMTMMTMFKLMLGLTDIEILYDARHPWMAIFLFIVCVLVTYVLLMNSLIALMSQTCALVSEDRRMQWELQRLSVIHLVETMLFPRWRYLHRPGLKARRYNLHNQALEWRCFSEITSIQTTYTDGSAIFRRKSMIRTIGFGDSGLSPMAPFIDKFRAGRSNTSGMNTLPPMYQHPSSLRGVGTISEEMYDDIDDDSSGDDETNPQSIKQDNKLMQVVAASKTNDIYDKVIDKNNSTNKQTRIHSPTENLSVASSSGSSSKKISRHTLKEMGEKASVSTNTNNNNSNNNNTFNTNSNTVITGQNKTLQHYLTPESRPQPPPRKRHNSERVNRKTQTTPNQGGQLSHSYPDSGLRIPLQQQGVLLPTAEHNNNNNNNNNINPQIVYVVPSSILPQQPLISNLTQASFPLPPPTPGSGVDNSSILHQMAAVPELRLQHPYPNTTPTSAITNDYTDDNAIYSQVAKPKLLTSDLRASQTQGQGQNQHQNQMRQPKMSREHPKVTFGGHTTVVEESGSVTTVQKLDIDTLNSTA